MSITTTTNTSTTNYLLASSVPLHKWWGDVCIMFVWGTCCANTSRPIIHLFRRWFFSSTSYGSFL